MTVLSELLPYIASILLLIALLLAGSAVVYFISNRRGKK
jgi:hypothetical protein